MGMIIERNASIASILEDLDLSVYGAERLKGAWAHHCERLLGPWARDALEADEQYRRAQRSLDRARCEMAARAREAVLAYASARDGLWNDRGRAAEDVDMELVFDGTLREFRALTVAERVIHINTAAKLLERGILRRTPLETQLQRAGALRAAADALARRGEDLEAAQSAHKLCREARKRLALLARNQLVHFKRAMLAEGFSEQDVHGVIPDRPRKGTDNAPAHEQASAAQTERSDPASARRAPSAAQTEPDLSARGPIDAQAAPAVEPQPNARLPMGIWVSLFATQPAGAEGTDEREVLGARRVPRVTFTP